MRTSISCVSIIIILVFLTAFHAEKKISLALNLEQGASYLLHADNQQQISTRVGEKSMENKTHVISDMDWKVSGKYGKDSTLIDAAYAYMMVKIDAASHQTVLDSKQDQSDADKYLRRLVVLMHNHPITLKTNARGDILAIRGADDLRRAVRDSLTAASGKGEAMLDKMLTDDALKTAFSIISIYPSEPVAVGDSWESDVLVDNIAKLNIHQKFTLKSFTPTTAVISVSSTIESAKDSLTFNGMTIPAHISGSRSGLYQVDRASGLLTDGKLNQDMVVKMSLMGQSLVVNTKGESLIVEKRKDR